MNVNLNLLFAGKTPVFERENKVKTDKIKTYIYNFLELKDETVEQHKYFCEQNFDLSGVKLLDEVSVTLNLEIGSQYSSLVNVSKLK